MFQIKRLTWAGGDAVGDGHDDLDAWFAFGAEGLAVGGDGEDGEEALEGGVGASDVEFGTEAGDGRGVGAQDYD